MSNHSEVNEEGGLVHVSSEFGRLRRVILCPPGSAHRRLTPKNAEELLFDSPIWVEKAVEAHAAFVRTLEQNGVEVLLVPSLLRDIFEAKPALIQEAIKGRIVNSQYKTFLSTFLEQKAAESVDAFIDHLMGGVTIYDIDAKSREQLEVTKLFEQSDTSAKSFLLRPIPNMIFTRDSSTVVGKRVCINQFRHPARFHESYLMQMIHQHHPKLADSDIMDIPAAQQHPASVGGVPSPPDTPALLAASQTFEGGDILVPCEGLVLMGTSERTSDEGLRALLRKLLQPQKRIRSGRGYAVRQVIACELPVKARSCMHLDTVLSFLDRDMCSTYLPITSKIRATSYFPRTGSESEPTTPSTDNEEAASGEEAAAEGVLRTARVVHDEPFFEVLEKALGLPRGGLRVIPTGGNDPLEQEREQWDDGNNLFAIAPRKVIAYDRNIKSNALLRAAGVTVLEIPSAELSAGRGGPHCLTCPVLRDEPPAGAASG